MSDMKDFREKLDSELENIKFGRELRSRVQEGTKNPQGPIRRFLEKEILIPVTPIAAAVLIAAAGITYVCTGYFRVTDADVRQSSIVIIENSNGRGLGR